MSAIYLLDTNFYRHTANDNTPAYQTTAKQFAIKLQHETRINDAVLLISEEVKCELEVQMHTLKPKACRLINSMLSGYRTTTTNLSLALEYDLRKFSNYLRNPSFNGLFAISGYSQEYLGASDARILADALANDAILVTHNIKDFILYSLLCEPNENKLYDFVKQQYVHVSPEARQQIAGDLLFIDLKEKLESLRAI